MAGEDQYIHPIVQALLGAQQQMATNRQLAAQIQNQQAERENAANETKIRQQQVDQAAEAIHSEAEYRKGMLQHSHDQMQAELGMNHLKAVDFVTNILKNGGTPGMIASATGGNVTGQPAVNTTVQGIPSIPDTRSINLPGGTQIPLSELPTRQQLIQQELDTARGLSGAKAEGELPSELTRIHEQQKGQMNLASQKEDFDERMKNKELDWAKIKERLDKDTQLQIANIGANAQKYRTDQEYGVTPEQSAAMIHGLITGQLKPNVTNPIDRKATTAALAAGARLPNDKDNQTFESLGQMKDIYAKIDNLASELPSEKDLGPTRASLNALGLGAIAGSPLKTDLKNKISELAPQVFGIVKNVQGYTGNRMNSQEMQYVQNGLTNVQTKEQLLDYKQKLQDSLDNRIGSSLEVGMPKFQQNSLHDAWGITPAWITQGRNSQLEQKGYKVNVEDSMKKGQVVYDAPE